MVGVNGKVWVLLADLVEPEREGEQGRWRKEDGWPADSKLLYEYRVTMVDGDMGWVDYDFGHSTACQVLQGSDQALSFLNDVLQNNIKGQIRQKIC